MKIAFPAGIGEYLNANGDRFKPDAAGLLDIASASPAPWLAAGFTIPDGPVVTTAARPTTALVPGQMVFDSTLGKPVWRNAANTAWVDATGAVV